MRISVRIKLSSHDTESITRFERSIVKESHIAEGYAVSGGADYLLIVSASDVIEFEKIHRQTICRLPGVLSIKADIPFRRIDLKENTV